MINQIRKKKLAVGMMLCDLAAIKAGRLRRRFRTRPINRKRRDANHFKYFLEMKENDDEQFRKFTRMNKDSFEKLLAMLRPVIEKQRRKDGIGAEERLVITLQYVIILYSLLFI